jgi:hypothetical protein
MPTAIAARMAIRHREQGRERGYGANVRPLRATANQASGRTMIGREVLRSIAACLDYGASGSQVDFGTTVLPLASPMLGNAGQRHGSRSWLRWGSQWWRPRPWIVGLALTGRSRGEHGERSPALSADGGQALRRAPDPAGRLLTPPRCKS